jgi:hypothetical protein
MLDSGQMLVQSLPGFAVRAASGLAGVRAMLTSCQKKAIRETDLAASFRLLAKS